MGYTAIDGLRAKFAPESIADLHPAARRSWRLHMTVVSLGAVLAWATVAQAARLAVDRTDDDSTASHCDAAMPNDCSLRGAILTANTLSEASVITLLAGTYVISQESSCTYKIQGNPHSATSSQVPLCITAKVAIEGAGADTTIIEGNPTDRVLFVSADASVRLSGLTISRGDLRRYTFGVIGGGGGINNHGVLTLTDSAITLNQADGGGGGGLYNAGTLTVLRSRVSGNGQIANVGEGGGIYNALPTATLTVADSTVSDNTAGTNGGGISIYRGTVTIANSTVSGNTALGGSGGGIVTFGAPGTRVQLRMTNSTISGNRVGINGTLGQGGGIYNHYFTDTALQNVTIADNASGVGGGIANADNGTVSLLNTLVADNRAVTFGPDCFAFAPRQSALTSRGHNLIETPADCDVIGDTSGNVLTEAPGLGLLIDNGGPTKTHALSDGSPAIDAGSPSIPGSGDGACAAADQRGFARPLGAACDIGALERNPAFSLNRIQPGTGGNSGTVSVLVSGNGFVPGTAVRLTRPGQPDILGRSQQVDLGGSAIAVVFDLVGRAIGPWDVVATHPGGESQVLPDGFTLAEGRLPRIWVDVIGRFFRPGRPSRLTLLYGNLGNVDAIAVPLSLTFPAGYAARRFFPLAAPPPQPGQVREDWTHVPQTVSILGEQSSTTQVPLMLPIVPAGFTGMLQIGLTLPAGAQDSLLLAAVGDPLFNPGLDPEAIRDAVAGSQAYLERFGINVPATLVADLDAYAGQQLQQVVERGRAAFVESLGTRSEVYSVAQLHFDLVLFGAARTGQERSGSARVSDWLPLVASSLGGLWSRLSPTESHAQQQNCPVPKKGETLKGGCSDGSGPDEPFLPPEIPPPPGCNLRDPSTFKNCKPTEDHCEALGTHKVVKDNDGNPFCVPKRPPDNCPKIPLDNPFLGSGNAQCKPFPLRPKSAVDPNDKVGTQGVMPAQFLLNSTPLSYSVFFENLENATAAAQTVEITDQLDVERLDLDTFRLGPITFGDVTLVPAPGVQEYTGGVDLRPEQPIVVTVHAAIDRDSGVLTWRFTSIDPGTGQLTEDPDAGFLPPNLTPPEGDGSVAFTVQAKPGLASGSTICNYASIVFDLNDPIATPEWCNTIDHTPPTSAVLPLPAMQEAASFVVQWGGTDVGAGIADYTIFVSDDGQPFTIWQTHTEELSATYAGLPGHRYAFYSGARDAVGNEEAPQGEADTATRIAGGESCDGDCSGDGSVTISELVTAVRIALTAAPLEECASADCRSTGSVPIDCLVRAVVAALNGCP